MAGKLTPQQSTALTSILKRINSALVAAGGTGTGGPLRDTAEFAISVIVKRTRLGGGVMRNFGLRYSLKSVPRSKKYNKYRQRLDEAGKLDNSITTAGTNNLTLTGQMLKSMAIISTSNNKVVIGPDPKIPRIKMFGTSTRANNAEIAAYQERLGRVFNRVSQPEYNQINRFYRRTFGDLLKKKHLLR